MIVQDRSWDGDFTVNIQFNAEQEGRLVGNRHSEDEKGWTLGVGENGAWYWAASDGETQFDYRPTAAKQNTLDGENHRLTFTLRRKEHEARFFFDRKLVAILDVQGLGSISTSINRLPVTAGRVGSYQVWRPARDDANFADVQELPDRCDRFTVLAFNIWHAGTEDGDEGFSHR